MTTAPPGATPAGDGPDYARVFDATPVPLLLLTPELQVVDANRAYLEATGTTLQAIVGRHLLEAFPGDPAADGPDALLASVERARDTGRTDSVPLQRYDVRMPEGEYAERFWSSRTVPVADDGGSLVLLLHRADDITDHVRDSVAGGEARPHEAAGGARWADRMREVEADLIARTQELERVNAELRVLSERQQRTAQSLAGLASTVSALAGAENRADLLRQLFRHGRLALGADALAVALSEPGGSHLAVVHTEDAVDRPPDQVPVQSSLPLAVAAGGRPVFEADAGQGAEPAPLRGLRAWASLPLRIGRRPLGSLTVGWDRPHPFEEDDVSVLQAFATQCSQAVHRVARLETERRRAHATRGLAETLQRALLTPPPQPEHLDIAVRYRPAAEEVQVGGDWYDAFLSPGGPVTLVVGDVTGHDWTAAAIAGQLRNMLRGIAFAFDVRAPEDLLTALDRAVAATGVPTLATALVARVEPAAHEATTSGARVLRWSNAGHPPPLLIGPEGTAELLERPRNLLLGVAADRPRQQHVADLLPGATVVLYTDGLVERRDATFDDGLDRLRAAGRELADRPVEELCDELLQRLHPDLTDDIALLAVRVRDVPDPG